MAKWNKEKRVLDHEHTKFWRYEVKDVEQPNLQKDVFPYDEVCRIVFDHKLVSMSPAEDIFITDTTFRDGQQSRPPYSVQQIVDIYRAKIVDVATESLTVEVTGGEDKIDSLLRLLLPFGITEMARTGRTALTRGSMPSIN